MLAFLFCLAILTAVLWLGYNLVGSLLRLCIWIFLVIPSVAFLWLLALICCCTIILIPVGVLLFRWGVRLFVTA